VTDPKRIRVLICDDSLLAREMIAQILATDPEIEVVGMCRDGAECVDKVKELRPDLVTMDVHMPRMDGLQATEEIMAFTPTPILVVSSSVYGEGMGAAFEALSAGALEVVKKPEPREWADMEQIGREIVRKVKILAKVKVITHVRGKRRGTERGPRIVAGEAVSPGGYRIVAIGSSTGGPSALMSVLSALPADLPVPVVIAQHIADGFVPGLVEWLDSGCAIKVAAASDGAPMDPSTVYLAPTGANLEVTGATLRFVAPGPGQLYIPCADTLLRSVAMSHGRRGIGVILTGMGSDGALGLKQMRDLGAATIAQDEATSVVYGMPRAAAENGAAAEVLPIDRIGPEVARLVLGE
jgi:two-component system chemotaxis response regulator CheB